MHAIGLGHPDQRDTQVMCVGIVLTAHGQPFDAVYAYRKVNALRVQIGEKRKTLSTNAVRCANYPENAIDYVRMAPRTYAPGQPPIESQIDIAQLR